MLRSDDGGQTWEPSNAGLFDFRILSVAVAATSDIIMLGTECGVYISTSRGRFWQDIPALDAIVPATVATLSNAGSIAVGSERGEVVLSRDEGNSWEQIGFDAAFSQPLELMVVTRPTGRETLMVVTPDGIFDVAQATPLWQASTITAASYCDGRLTVVTDDGSVRTISLSDL